MVEEILIGITFLFDYNLIIFYFVCSLSIAFVWNKNCIFTYFYLKDNAVDFGDFFCPGIFYKEYIKNIN